MTMQLLVVIQVLLMFLAYTLVTIALPSLLLHRVVEHRRLTERFVFYFICGNFYIINLVYVLELLHICYTFTLILGTIAPFLIYERKYKPKTIISVLKRIRQNFQNILRGTMGKKTALLRFGVFVRNIVLNLSVKAIRIFREHMKEWCLFLVFVVVTVVLFGFHQLEQYGYGASDLSVHNLWINEMEVQNIFCKGVYPFGFHCTIFYLHKVFGFEIVVLLRGFAIVQTLYIFLMLLSFLKLCGHVCILAYIWATFFVVFQGFGWNTYWRYTQTLPQEFGMLFILPSIAYMLLFFKERRREIEEGEEWRDSRYCLIAFGISFAMSLSAHFYDTMIAGLFCLAMVPGFIFCIFKKNYFWSILRTGLLSILIAILPMGIAFAFGTPLQGSLGWGMEIITGKTEEDTQETEIGTEFEFETEFESEIGIDTEIGTETQIGTESSSELLGDSQFEEIPEEEIEGEPGIPQGGVQIQEPKKESLVKRLGRVIRKYPGVVVKLLKEYIFVENFSWAVTAFLIGLCLLFVFGVICFRFGNLWYGGVLVTVGVYQFLMITLLASKELGLPALMDASRTSIFLTYTLVCVPFFITDICCVRIRRRIESNKVAKTISAVAYAAIALVLCTQGLVKPPVFVPRDGMMQTNGAIVCVTNLMRYHERNNWTIVSANDERNMIYNYGRHEELWNFVFEMETYSALKTRIIPTEEVYFFIEKQPLFCLGDETFEGMFETITPEDARHPLSNSFGNDFYKGKARRITMARAYYWAQEFNKLYPHEMSVYYEDEEFICYRLKQSVYRPFNLAIDYGYNTINWWEESWKEVEKE